MTEAEEARETLLGLAADVRQLQQGFAPILARIDALENSLEHTYRMSTPADMPEFKEECCG